MGLTVSAAAALWLLPVFASRNLAATIVLHWGGAALALLAAGLWRMRFGRASAADWKAWAWLGLLMAPGFLLLTLGEPRAPERMLRLGMLLTLAWLVFVLMRPHADKLWSNLAWGAALTGSAVVHWLLSAFTMLHPNTWLSAYVDGFSGPLMQSNWEALWFVVALCWLAQYLDQRAGDWRPGAEWLALGAGGLLVSGIFLSGSRSGLLTLLLIAFVSIWLNRKEQRRNLLRWIVMGVAGVLMAKAMLLVGGEARGLVREANIGGVGARFLIWALAWKAFVSHAWLGVGWGGLPSHGMDMLEQVLTEHPEWAAIAGQEAGAHLYAHNWILQMLVEAGILGGVFALALVMALTKEALRLASASMGKRAGWLVCLAMLAQGMLSVSMMEPYFWFVFAMAAAAAWPVNETVVHRLPPQPLDYLWLLPAVSLGLFSAWQLRAAHDLDAAMRAPLHSKATLSAFGKAMDNPWLHATALHRLFVKLAADHASSAQWAAAEPFAWALWQTAQAPDDCMIFIAIEHAKQDVLAERRWAARYLRLRPGFAPALRAYRHAWHRGPHPPLLLEPTW